jgi:hypothetical protein
MPNVTFAVPEDLHKEMRRHGTVNWPEVLRRAIVRELDLLHAYDRLLKDSKLTEEDAVELGREIRAAMAKRSRKP